MEQIRMTKDFYDRLAPFYHMIYPDWEQSIERQAAQLEKVIQGYLRYLLERDLRSVAWLDTLREQRIQFNS